MNETLNSIIKYLSDNWTVIAGVVATLAYLTEKLVSYYSDNKKKKEAYHRVFTGTVKLYFSYHKHRLLYQEKAIMGITNEVYVIIAKYLDSFNADIESFKKIIDEETDIIPEIALTTHIVFDIVGRFQVIDRISASGQPDTTITDNLKLEIKKAQFYALEEFLNDFFKEAIEEIRKKTLVSKKFTDRLFHLNSEQYQKETIDEQLNLMRRYYESLHRQGVIDDDFYNALLSELTPPESED